jgi:ADP-heptose:LPS heptosyltransferase
MSKIELNNKTVLISRTDSIGDVCLTLPICKALKDKYPDVRIVFLGKSYTEAIIRSCSFVDDFFNWDEWNACSDANVVQKIIASNLDAVIHVFPNKSLSKLAFRAKIPMRIGTNHRLFHWLTCNHLINFTRKKSELHEAQLNFKLLQPFDIEVPSLAALNEVRLLQTHTPIPAFITQWRRDKKCVILHCKSQGSAVEWGIPNFMALAERLIAEGHQVIFTGTESEGQIFRPFLPKHDNLLDSSGKLTLTELIAVIGSSDALVAASTGPLHIAGLLGIRAVGLFSPRRPIHPGRWQPLGKNSVALVYDENCQKCKKGEFCKCIEEIEVGRIISAIFA